MAVGNPITPPPPLPLYETLAKLGTCMGWTWARHYKQTSLCYYVEYIALDLHQGLADALLHANCIAYKQMEALILPILKMGSV